MPTSAQQICDQFPELVSFAEGSPSATAQSPASAEDPQANSIVYVAQSTHLERCLLKASLIVTTEKIASTIDTLTDEKALLITPDPSIAMSHVNQHFFPNMHLYSPTEAGVHKTAIVDESAKLGANVSIGPGAVVGANATLGESVRIGSNAVIETEAVIGKNTHIHALAYVGPECVLGSDCVIHPNTVVGCEGFGFSSDKNWFHNRKPQYGRVLIGDRVEIGANVSIDRGAYEDTVIGSGTKIDNHCHIAHNVQIGENNLITAGFIVAGSSKIGDRNMFGGRTSMNGHITIGSDAVYAGTSVISGPVEKPGRYGGYPLQDYKKSLKMVASFAKLPELRQQMKEFKAELEELKNRITKS